MQCMHGSYRSSLCFKQASRIWNFFPWRLMYTAFKWNSDISLALLGISHALLGSLSGVLPLHSISGMWHKLFGVSITLISGSPKQQRHSATADPPATQPSAKLKRSTNSNTISILLPNKQSNQRRGVSFAWSKHERGLTIGCSAKLDIEKEPSTNNSPYKMVVAKPIFQT